MTAAKEEPEPALWLRLWWRIRYDWLEMGLRVLWCRIVGHYAQTEYRYAEDYYGVTWCTNCGKWEPMFTMEDRRDQINRLFYPIIERCEELRYQWKQRNK